MSKSVERKVEISRPSLALRPPPLFRSIGPPGPSAGLPPHRRLRSIFCRSRAVLPANVHPIEASDAHAFTNIQTGNHAGTIVRPLSEDTKSGTALIAHQPEVDSDLHTGAVFRSGVLAATRSSASASTQVQSEQQDRQLCSHLCPTTRANGRNKGRQGRWVTPPQTSEDPAIKEKQQPKGRKKSFKVDCAGKQKYAAPSHSEKEEDARLCEWLQSLGLAGSKEGDSVAPKDQRQLFASRRSGVSREQGTAASHRRDRRPHFLPPLCQSGSLLHVPLLLPENSPPPLPCTYPNPPIHQLPVPLLQPLLSRRK
ncbi:hypothetical protein VZT92_008017 [Zoarces viviparus]|uniref:Uncharacterized protein n=1 Tax=Zoarces viviparus TaxID=48416 RepID=A0AAW1FMC1_ZOAVI